jgi:SH3-like domain-containing protein
VAGAVAALALACCAGLGALGWHLHAQWRIVTTADAALRSAPDADASSLRTMKAATNVKVLRSYEDWLFVTTEQGDQGWVPEDNAAKVWNR